MPNSDTVKVARCVQGWARARGNEWKGRLEREEARKNEGAREAEEEEKAREAREAAAARNRVSAGAGSSEREVELETRGGVGEARRDNGEKGEMEAVEETPKKTMQAVPPTSQAVATKNAEGAQILEKKTEATKEKTGVVVAEVPSIQLGVAWDARDPSQRLGDSSAQISN
jgi:hypothetical protein